MYSLQMQIITGISSGVFFPSYSDVAVDEQRISSCDDYVHLKVFDTHVKYIYDVVN